MRRGSKTKPLFDAWARRAKLMPIGPICRPGPECGARPCWVAAEVPLHAAPVAGAFDWPEKCRLDLRVRSAIEFMAAHLGHPIGAADIAARTGVSPEQLRQLFRHQTGLAPMRTLKLIRLRRAKSLLDSTGKRIEQVAVETGLADGDLSHFRRDFALAAGIPPGRYRKFIHG